MGEWLGDRSGKKYQFESFKQKGVGINYIGKFTVDIFIQHHRAVQQNAAIHRLAKLPQTACMDLPMCYRKKQPAKVDH